MSENHDKPFDGDTYVLEEVDRIIKTYNVQYAIETGTWKGGTTEFLAQKTPWVFTIEGGPNEVFVRSDHLRNISNCIRIQGNSGQVLKGLLPLQRADYRGLFYLDAHVEGRHSPLLDELDAIYDSCIKEPVIIIHDFFNPNHPEYVWSDFFDIGPYKWNLISDRIEKIYAGRFSYWYNDKANGPMHGVVYIAPDRL